MSSASAHDILIIGAGIAGLGAAYRLRENDVVVLETNDFAVAPNQVAKQKRDAFCSLLLFKFTVIILSFL